ncbi:sensor histidine kinase [Pinibacter soli]|uniref:Sensor histidine kinase n=1 Tax=Pinibacter soli TaxID=3044211 RepID=A0ABT6RFI3_9BACT|nr:sensor histidine kinase [Pinibacter soli]MDI3321186.1 sensor histidine kinase [Pinibacter soli]
MPLTNIQPTSGSKIRQIVMLFLIFQAFWFLFYILSGTLLKVNDVHIVIMRRFFIHCNGFLSLSLGAFVIFPYFIAKRRFYPLLIIVPVIIFVLANVDLAGQRWLLSPTRPFKPIANLGGKSVAMATLQLSPIAWLWSTVGMLVYMLLGIGYAYMRDWFVKDRETRILQQEKTSAELALLRYQLNPHFLFNTINDIYYLALIQSASTADALLELSDLLRYVLHNKDEKVSVHKEIEYLKQFIKLHLFRFTDDVIILNTDIDEPGRECLIAPLILSTFLENACKHGQLGTEEIPITALIEIKNKQLLYRVENVIDEGKVKDATSGIGLPNLQRRLSLLYPGHHTISLQEEEGKYIAELQIDLAYDNMHRD